MRWGCPAIYTTGEQNRCSYPTANAKRSDSNRSAYLTDLTSLLLASDKVRSVLYQSVFLWSAIFNVFYNCSFQVRKKWFTCNYYYCAAFIDIITFRFLLQKMNPTEWFSEISEQLWPNQCFSLKVKKVLHEERSKFQDIKLLET